MSLCWQWDHGETEWVLRIGLCRCLLISWTQSGKILVCASAGNGRHCVGANGVALFLTPVSVRLCLRVYVSHSLSPLCGACALLIRRCRPVIDSTRVRPFNAYIIRKFSAVWSLRMHSFFSPRGSLFWYATVVSDRTIEMSSRFVQLHNCVSVSHSIKTNLFRAICRKLVRDFFSNVTPYPCNLFATFQADYLFSCRCHIIINSKWSETCHLV